MKWALLAFGVVALGALVWGSCEGRRASKADVTRDSMLAVSALLKNQNAALAARAEDAGDQAARATRLADSAGRRAAALEAIVRRPTPLIPAPDTSASDSTRYWKATAEDLQVRLLAAGQALEARAAEVGDLRAALDSQTVATAQIRVAYEGERTRADGLETALRKMPSACPRFLGIPRPRVGIGYGLTSHGIGPTAALIIPLGC